MAEGSTWIRVVATVDPRRAELAADRLWAHGPAAIEERDGPGVTVLLAGFDDRDRARRAADALEAAGLGRAELRAVTDDGLDGWRAWAHVEHAPPFVIVPTWLDVPPLGPDDHALLVDPAHTFGSGSHPTTRLVLGRLAALVRPGHRVLDVGCGSGILAVGAALLGAGSVVGTDVDPGSPAATAENAVRNGVADRVAAGTTPLAELVGFGPGFDVVAANLLAPVVASLAPHLVDAVAPTGALVVSGLLADRWAEATDHLVGLAVTDVAVADGWAAVTLRHPG